MPHIGELVQRDPYYELAPDLQGYSDPLKAGLYSYTGVVALPTFVDNGDGSVTIGTGTYALSQTNTGQFLPKPYPILGGVFTLTDGVLNYLIADYNSGTPVVRLTTNVLEITEVDICPIRTMFRTGTVINQLDWDSLGLYLPNKIHQSIVKTQRYRRQDGLGLSELATRRIIVAAGIVWYGAASLLNAACDSSTDETDLFYHTAGVWTKAAITQYNNTQYDDGTNLQPLNPNRYAVNFIYRLVNSVSKKIYVLLGAGNYNLAQAQQSQPPMGVPPEISSMAILVGRIIVETGAATASQTDSAFAVSFTGSPATNHNDLGGLQGGAAGEFFHLTSAQHTSLTTDVVHLSGAETITGAKKFGTATDYTTFEADGTMVAGGAGTTWRDIVFPLVLKTTGTGNPSMATFTGGITAPQFLVNDNLQLEASEFIHEWKEGSEIMLHLHWTSMTNVAATRGVKWEIGYSYVLSSSGTSQWTAETVIQAETTVPANTPALTEFILSMGAFTPVGGKIGGQIRMRVKRIAATGTAPATAPFLSQVGAHVECDTVGSRSVGTK